MRRNIEKTDLPWKMGLFTCLVVLCAASACDHGMSPGKDDAEGKTKDRGPMDQRPAPMAQPVPLWNEGKVEKKVDAATASVRGLVVLDLGNDWTPYIFSEIRADDSAADKPNSYRKTYLALARSETPDDLHGERASRDKYLELYGIMPTLEVLRQRFEDAQKLTCKDNLNLQPLLNFDGFVAYRSSPDPKIAIQKFGWLENRVKRIMNKQGVSLASEVNLETLKNSEKYSVKQYLEEAPKVAAVRAAQDRLKCEGYFDTPARKKYQYGAIDWRTHEALAEFERRHRVYGWGYIGRETIEKLRQGTLELERQAVIRVLTERAMHAAGVIEDGSMSKKYDGQVRTYKDAQGNKRAIPNIEENLREQIVSSFNLKTPESTLAWLQQLGDIGKERLIAIRGPHLPDYYDGNMDLSVVVDRGDVWYDFPYDEAGKEKPQPVRRRPKVIVYTNYRGQKIPLASFGTTIGGWRTEFVEGRQWWKYKESPPGERVWAQIVASPVWLPPESTPPRTLLRKPDPAKYPRRSTRPDWIVDYYETGPGYASAYGLVAAYHLKYRRMPDGSIELGPDEGIRMHGSVDYMSIMRRHSHGCHRLHNHIAVRLMSFILAHRPHQRVGQQKLAFRRDFEHEGEVYNMAIDEGGYIFELNQPLVVNVLEGRIQGKVKKPVEGLLPQFDEEIGAYILPDNSAVTVSPNGVLSPVPLPPDVILDPLTGRLIKQPPPPEADPSVSNPSDPSSAYSP